MTEYPFHVLVGRNHYRYGVTPASGGPFNVVGFDKAVPKDDRPEVVKGLLANEVLMKELGINAKNYAFETWMDDQNLVFG